MHGRPVTCFEMAGMPSEVVNSVCSVLARLAFDLALWSEGRLKLLVLCEEAHRYMPADPRLGFAPTRHALSRIAKEGRKYGCYLGVVTQRPGELDPTILSQCSTFFAMRLANEQDQAIIRSAIADSSASTLSFLSSMGQREAIAFGEGVATTMRLKFEKLAQNLIPGAGQAHRRTSPQPESATTSISQPSSSGCATCRSRSSRCLRRTVSRRQAGDPDYRKPAIAERVTGRRSRLALWPRNRRLAAAAERLKPRMSAHRTLEIPRNSSASRMACFENRSGADFVREHRKREAASGSQPHESCWISGADAVPALPSSPHRAGGRRGGRSSSAVSLRSQTARPTLAVIFSRTLPDSTDMPAIALRMRSANLDQQLGVHIGRDHRELLAAEPRHHVVIARHVLEATGDCPQHLVADIVTMCVVDLLEMIEIEDHQPDRLLDAAEFLEIFLQRIVEIAPVLHAGQTVGQRRMLQRFASGR